LLAYQRAERQLCSHAAFRRAICDAGASGLELTNFCEEER